MDFYAFNFSGFSNRLIRSDHITFAWTSNTCQLLPQPQLLLQSYHDYTVSCFHEIQLHILSRSISLIIPRIIEK